jgi:hypothetical protein
MNLPRPIPFRCPKGRPPKASRPVRLNRSRRHQNLPVMRRRRDGRRWKGGKGKGRRRWNTGKKSGLLDDRIRDIEAEILNLAKNPVLYSKSPTRPPRPHFTTPHNRPSPCRLRVPHRKPHTLSPRVQCHSPPSNITKALSIHPFLLPALSLARMLRCSRCRIYCP